MPQEKESFSNIFEAAGKFEKSKHEKSKLDKVQESAAVPAQPLTDEELILRFDRCKELHNIIQDNLEKAFEEHNITQKQVREYFDSPQHFSQQQWQIIQEQKDEVSRKLKELVPKVRSGARASSSSGVNDQKKPKIMQTKSRWMPMR